MHSLHLLFVFILYEFDSSFFYFKIVNNLLQLNLMSYITVSSLHLLAITIVIVLCHVYHDYASLILCCSCIALSLKLQFDFVKVRSVKVKKATDANLLVSSNLHKL